MIRGVWDSYFHVLFGLSEYKFHPFSEVQGRARIDPKMEGIMTIMGCPKCGLCLIHDYQEQCSDCAKASAKRRMMMGAVMLPVILAVAVVVSGLPL